MKPQHNFFIFVVQCNTLGFAKSFPESGLNGDYSTLYVRDTAAVSTGICTDACCPEEALCCGGNCYPDIKVSNTTICCGNTGFDTSITGSDNAYCCGDTLFAYNGTNFGLNCCNAQSSSACLGNQECCDNGSCIPLGTDCPAPGQDCGDGQFVCGGRCGATDFGDTCCPTSVNGTHAMCGLGTQCCGDGCCPIDWICTDAGGCIPVPSLVPSVGDFVSQGCFSDSIDSRALDNSFKDPAGMTVQECVEHAGSHKYAAVEFGSECYFGDALLSSNAIDSLSCNMGCSGNMSQLCGGSNAINLYQNQRFAPPSTTTPSALTTSAITSTKTPVPTLSIGQLLAVFNRLESDIQNLNDLVKTWQDAIASASKRSISRRQSQTQTEVIALQAVQSQAEVLVLYLRGGPLPETTRNLQDLEDDALSDATEAAAADEIELEEVNLLNNQIDDFNDQASDVVETFSDSASWEATDAAVAQRAFTSTTAVISFLGLVVISLGAIFFGTHHNGGGGGGGGITTVVTVGTSITTIVTTPESTLATSMTSSSSSAPACEFSAAATEAAIIGRAITCDDSCLTGREDDYPISVDTDDEYDGDLEKRQSNSDNFAPIRRYDLRSINCPVGWNTAKAPYPPTPPNPNIPPTGADSLDIPKFLDMQLVPSNQPLGLCSWQLIAFPVRQSRTGVGLNAYHTEHVLEIHFVKSFLTWILNQNLIRDCTDLVNTFFLESAFPQGDSNNEIQNFIAQITWWSITNNIPFDGTIPRFEEFFILEGRLNSMKNYILHAGDINVPFSLAQPNGLWTDVYQKLRDMSLTIEYLNRQDVSNAFETTYQRFITYLQNFDQNIPAGGVQPGAPYNSWENAFKAWLTLFLNTRSTQQLGWRQQAIQYIQQAFATGANMQGFTPAQVQAMRNSFNGLITNGPLSLNAMTMSQEYTKQRE